ncbi:MAG: hypothetical protein HA495_08560 [Thaumarchaeota archaeon]|jgi:transglutaminase-like putative cysteine protease|nr:hypothetical protein [Nitrososphaerota archaeon]
MFLLRKKKEKKKLTTCKSLGWDESLEKFTSYKVRQDVMQDELIESLSEPRHKVYNIDGYKLRLVNYRLVPEKVRTKVIENGKVVEHEVLKEKIEDGTIIVDKRSRLYKFPLEKIEFLKEDFPELFR